VPVRGRFGYWPSGVVRRTELPSESAVASRTLTRRWRLCVLRRRLRAQRAQFVVDVTNLLSEAIELPGHPLDLGRGAAVDVEIELAADAVLLILAILTHHDDRRLDGGDHRQDQIQQNEWVWIPCALAEAHISEYVNGQQDDRRDDKCPRAAEAAHDIREPLAEGLLGFDQLVRIARRGRE
jgi:hypothetical protein